jgi:hypothetical protein
MPPGQSAKHCHWKFASVAAQPQFAWRVYTSPEADTSANPVAIHIATGLNRSRIAAAEKEEAVVCFWRGDLDMAIPAQGVARR